MLPLLLRKLDRAGVMDLAPSYPAVDVVALAVGLPVDVVAVGLPALTKVGVVELHGDTLVMPNFLAAQEASMSDAQRQREARARRRDKARAVTKCDTSDTHVVTERDPTVTPGHTESHAVTPSVPSVPDLAEPDLSRRTQAPDVRSVFDHWVKTMGKTKAAKLGPKRRRAIERALKSHGMDIVLKAIDGCAKSPWHTGENPGGKRYDDLTLILRDEEKIEAFAAVQDGTAGLQSWPCPRCGADTNDATGWAQMQDGKICDACNMAEIRERETGLSAEDVAQLKREREALAGAAS